MTSNTTSSADNNDDNNDENNNNTTNATMMMRWTKQDLFGGAITCDIPQEWRDVSLVRQVPDNQEVYQEVNTNRFVVVEVLEYQSHIDGAKEAASFFFTNLAEDNGILNVEEHVRLDTLVDISSSFADPCFTHMATHNKQCTTNDVIGGAVGYQNVAKEERKGGEEQQQHPPPQNQPMMSWIQVELCVLRLAAQETDLLLILSTPVENPPDVTPSTTTTVAAAAEEKEQSSFSDTFSRIVSTFTIQDWSLFG